MVLAKASFLVFYFVFVGLWIPPNKCIKSSHCDVCYISGSWVSC